MSSTESSLELCWSGIDEKSSYKTWLNNRVPAEPAEASVGRSQPKPPRFRWLAKGHRSNHRSSEGSEGQWNPMLHPRSPKVRVAPRLHELNRFVTSLAIFHWTVEHGRESAKYLGAIPNRLNRHYLQTSVVVFLNQLIGLFRVFFCKNNHLWKTDLAWLMFVSWLPEFQSLAKRKQSVFESDMTDTPPKTNMASWKITMLVFRGAFFFVTPKVNYCKG